MGCAADVYYQGNTMVFELTQVQDVTGASIAGATGTATVYDLAGTSLGSAAFVDAGGGTYRALLAHTIAAPLQREVDIDAILDAAGQRGRWRVRVPVRHRPLTP